MLTAGNLGLASWRDAGLTVREEFFSRDSVYVADEAFFCGTGAEVTPVVEAEQIAENLKRRDVPVEFLMFPDEGHGFRKTPNRIKSTVSLVEFFVKHLRPQAAPSS